MIRQIPETLPIPRLQVVSNGRVSDLFANIPLTSIV